MGDIHEKNCIRFLKDALFWGKALISTCVLKIIEEYETGIVFPNNIMQTI